MSRIKLKVGSPLRKVKIIKGDDIIAQPREGILPFFHERPLGNSSSEQDRSFKEMFSAEDIDLEKEVPGKYDIDISSLIETDSNEKVIDDDLEEDYYPPENPTFFIEHRISNIDKPIQIDLSNIQEDTISISEAKQKIQEAYDRGFSDGKEVAGSTFIEDINKQQQWIRNFDNIVTDLRIQYSYELGILEEAVTKLALSVSEHILGYEVAISSEAIINQFKKAFAELDNELIIKIHIHPDNIEALKAIQSDLVEDSSRMRNVVIIADEKIGKGGCVLETNAGIIDAKIKTQLQNISEALMKTPQQDIENEADFDEYEQSLNNFSSEDNLENSY